MGNWDIGADERLPAGVLFPFTPDDYLYVYDKVEFAFGYPVFEYVYEYISVVDDVYINTNITTHFVYDFVGIDSIVSSIFIGYGVEEFVYDYVSLWDVSYLMASQVNQEQVAIYESIALSAFLPIQEYIAVRNKAPYPWWDIGIHEFDPRTFLETDNVYFDVYKPVYDDLSINDDYGRILLNVPVSDYVPLYDDYNFFLDTPIYDAVGVIDQTPGGVEAGWDIGADETPPVVLPGVDSIVLDVYKPIYEDVSTNDGIPYFDALLSSSDGVSVLDSRVTHTSVIAGDYLDIDDGISAATGYGVEDSAHDHLYIYDSVYAETGGGVEEFPYDYISIYDGSLFQLGVPVIDYINIYDGADFDLDTFLYDYFIVYDDTFLDLDIPRWDYISIYDDVYTDMGYGVEGYIYDYLYIYDYDSLFSDVIANDYLYIYEETYFYLDTFLDDVVFMNDYLYSDIQIYLGDYFYLDDYSYININMPIYDYIYLYEYYPYFYSSMYVPEFVTISEQPVRYVSMVKLVLLSIIDRIRRFFVRVPLPKPRRLPKIKYPFVPYLQHIVEVERRFN